MSEKIYDAIVIGGGFNGLAAAACLARAGKATLLLEASDNFGGRLAAVSDDKSFPLPLGPQTLFALDPVLIRQMRLAKAGLKFAVRDMPLVGLRSDGKHLVLTRNARATASNIAVHSKHDAEMWPQFQRELFDLGRALRPFWSGTEETVDAKARETFERLSRTAAMAWLDSWFDSDTLKSTLVFDATADGYSAIAPGSALAFVWRASQEMSGLQGAVAFPLGGFAAFAQVAIKAAYNAGAEMRTGALVQSLLLNGAVACGVKLSSGEEIFSRGVLSSLTWGETFASFLPPLTEGIVKSSALKHAAGSLAEAKLVFALNKNPLPVAPNLPSVARFVIAEKPETYAEGEMAARNGALASELPMEVVIAMAPDDGLAPTDRCVVSVLIRPVPSQPKTPWSELKPVLTDRVKAALARYFPNLPGAVTQTAVQTPDERPAFAVRDSRFTAKPASQISSSISGLYFCGPDSDPMTAVSGNAACIAAGMAAEALK
jgi:phytoene dehydrogenase-like protein